MKLLKQLLIAIFVLSCLAGAAQRIDGYTPMENVLDFKQSIQAKIGSIETIQADFQQEKNLAIFSKTIESEGKMTFKAPDKLKWGYTQPYDYVITIHGQTITIDDAGNVKTFDLSASEKFSGINRLILNSITGKILDDQSFETAYYENESTYLVVLSPKDGDIKRYMNAIQMYISKADKQVSGIKLIESESDFTRISFSDQVLNEPVANEIFEAQ